MYVIDKTLIVIFVPVLEEESRRPLGHKRSLSSESPRSLMHTEEAVTYPSYIVAGSREMAIDVYDLKGICFLVVVTYQLFE